MYQEFTIQTVETDLINKKIIVTTGMDIDPNSIDEIDATLYNRETREPITLIPEIKGNILELTLAEWPKLNSPYIFTLKPLKNILKELSRSGIKRKIEFTKVNDIFYRYMLREVVRFYYLLFRFYKN